MELIYIYVLEHKILNDFGAELSSNFKVENFEGVITISKKNILLDYYDGLNIKAIIGKNGAGKSSLLDFIEESCNPYTESRGFIIWHDSFKDEMIIHDISHAAYKFKIESCLKYKVVSNNSTTFKNNNHKIYKINNLPSNEIFIKKRNKKNVIDLSLGSQSKLKGKNRTKNLKRLLEFFNESEWLANKHAKYIYTFHFKNTSTTINRWINKLLNEGNEDLHEDYISSFRHDFEMYTSSDLFDEKNVSIDSIYQGLLIRNVFSFIKSFPSIHIGNSSFTDEFCRQFINGPLLNDPLKHDLFLDALISFNAKWIVGNGGNKSDAKATADNEYIKFHCSVFFKSMLNVAEIVYYSVMNGNVRRGNEFSTNDYLTIVSILQNLAALPPGLANNFRYGWEGFSTGELAKLNLFSSIYNLVSKEKEMSGLIVIDEVDLFLHPEWQRNFISELISFYKEFNHAKLQFLITTHSPLIIGDLLSDDIVSMHIQENGLPVKIKSFGFGTEITDAYVLGMHIQSTFGEHSRVKLLELINKKKMNELSAKDRALIDMISNQELKRNLSND